MAHAHTEYVEGCFTCKLRTIQFEKSWMPSQGGKVALDAVAEDFGTKDKSVRGEILDKTRGVGHLNWHHGQPYKRNRVDGSWERATKKDTETMLGATAEESRRAY